MPIPLEAMQLVIGAAPSNYLGGSINAIDPNKKNIGLCLEVNSEKQILYRSLQDDVWKDHDLQNKLSLNTVNVSFDGDIKQTLSPEIAHVLISGILKDKDQTKSYDLVFDISIKPHISESNHENHENHKNHKDCKD